MPFNADEVFEMAEQVDRLAATANYMGYDALSAIYDDLLSALQVFSSRSETAGAEEIDALLASHSQHWKISRMSGVDRNIMKIAIYEMMYCDDVPFKVAINEAIEIGKRFSTEDSGAFINGVLDSIRKNIEQQVKNESRRSQPGSAYGRHVSYRL